jgi:uncharacterized protein YodC (DUF2158 family)
MAQNFKTGDVVILKSGGPHMTVKKYKSEIIDIMSPSKESDHIIICTWFEKNNKLAKGEFDQNSLMLVN